MPRYPEHPYLVENCYRLDIHCLLRDLKDARPTPIYWPGGSSILVTLIRCEQSLRLQYTAHDEIIRQAVALSSTAPHYGGLRWWARCPGCCRRVAKLYLPPNLARFLCRRCHGLVYGSTRLTPSSRWCRKAARIRRQLGADSGAIFGSMPPRPSRMKWNKYIHLTDIAREIEDRIYAAWTGLL